MKKILILIVFLSINLFSFSLNLITTAESVSWNGAYTSISDGFEAMLYNPAGIYMTDRRFGLNAFGSYGLRIYNNSFSSDTFIKIYKSIKDNGNITDIVQKNLNLIPEAGFDLGLDASLLNFMLYVKLNKFSLGISIIPKTYSTITMSKSIFTSIFDNISLFDPINASVKGKFIQYLDLNFNLSTRVGFLEKNVPVEAIYAGMTGHFYLPTIYFDTNDKIKVSSGAYDSNGFNTYQLKTDGELNVGGFLPAILKYSSLSSTYGSLFNNDAGAGFGLGVDLGFIIKFNKIFRLGFSATDIGFIAFPQTAKINVNMTQNISISNLDEVFNYPNRLIESVKNTDPGKGYKILLAPLALRIGAGITPFKSNYFDFTIAADISASDFDRILNNEYATFNFSAGFEFAPKYNWFQMPLRLSFNYNSQSNIPSFSQGIGFYFGPVELEIGIKGLEFLISNWGAREMAVAADLKYEF